jgi:SulP family sulfate permease
LIGQGIGNSIGAIFGGFPEQERPFRTVVNIQSGGKTRLSGMIAGIVLLLILLVLSPLASKIPAAVLAGILVTVGIGVMDYKGLNVISKIPRTEIIIMVVVLLLSVLWNLVYAVGIGLLLACLFFMKKMGDISKDNSKIGLISNGKGFDEIDTNKDGFISRQEYENSSISDGYEKDLSETSHKNVYVKHLNGPLFFGFTSEFVSIANKIPKTASILIIDMEKVPYIDQSGLFALEDVLLDLDKKNIKTLITGIQSQPIHLMKTIGILGKLIPEERVFDSLADSKAFIIDNKV